MPNKEIFIRGDIYYFTDKENWQENTEKIAEIVRDYIESHEIRDIIVASSRGYTAAKVAKALEGKEVNIVTVKMSQGIDDIYEVSFNPEDKKFLESKGIPILMAPHTLTGAVDYALVEKFKGIPPTTLIAETLYLFSQGMKVCVEIATMACDAGLVKEGKEAIAVAGTGQGADTAIVVKTATSPKIFNLDIRQILAMPLEK